MKFLFAITLLAGLPQAPPTVAGIDLDESDHRDRIEAAWDEAGVETDPEVTTPTGGRCDLVTPGTAWELDWAEKWAEGVGQASYYATDLNRDAGLLLLAGDGDSRLVARAKIACERAGVRLLLIPLAGDVPLPAVGGHLVDAEKMVGRELMIIGAAWCQACQAVPRDVEGTRYLDLDADLAEVVRLYGGVPPAIPAYVLVVDGEGVKNWRGPTTRGGIEIMRDWEP